MRTNLILALLAFCLVSTGYAQKDEIPNDYKYQDLKEKFPKASFIRLKDHDQFVFDIKKNELEIYTVADQDLICMNQNAVNLQKRSIGYDQFFPILDLEASLKYPEKGKYKVEKIKDFQDQAVITDGVSFYDDHREKVYRFENIREGAVLNYKLTRSVKDKFLTPRRSFNHSLVTLNDRLEIKCHKDIELGIFSRNIEGSSIQYTEEEEGNYRYYIWEQIEEKQYNLNGQSDYSDHFWPIVIPYVKSYTIKGEKVNVLNDVSDLQAWYNSLIEQVHDQTEGDLESLALEITKGKETELEKVRAVYQWVQHNIKYIAFSDGYGGFIPRDPDLVYERRFGDCKDMSCLIINTLSELDIPAYFTWVGTRDIPFNYSDIPSPHVDNHMIATYYDKSGKVYYLDATASDLRFGEPSYSIQGKEALVSFKKDSFKIESIPLSRSMSNYSLDQVLMQVKDQVITGKGKYLVLGYQSEDIHRYYKRQENDNERKVYLKNILEKGSNKFNLSSFDYYWDDESKDSLSVSYEFDLRSYTNQVNQDLYLNLNLYKDLKQFKISENRKVATFFEYPYKERKEFVLELPRGSTVKFVPENSHYEDDLLAYTIKYELKEEQLVYTLEFEQKIIQVNPEEMDQWNQNISKLSEALDQSTIITLNHE